MYCISFTLTFFKSLHLLEKKLSPTVSYLTCYFAAFQKVEEKKSKRLSAYNIILNTVPEAGSSL